MLYSRPNANPAEFEAVSSDMPQISHPIVSHRLVGMQSIIPPGFVVFVLFLVVLLSLPPSPDSSQWLTRWCMSRSCPGRRIRSARLILSQFWSMLFLLFLLVFSDRRSLQITTFYYASSATQWTSGMTASCNRLQGALKYRGNDKMINLLAFRVLNQVPVTLEAAQHLSTYGFGPV
jgi:hypothetical protein